MTNEIKKFVAITVTVSFALDAAVGFYAASEIAYQIVVVATK